MRSTFVDSNGVYSFEAIMAVVTAWAKLYLVEENGLNGVGCWPILRKMQYDIPRCDG